MTGERCLLVASNNLHKVEEFRRILTPLGFAVVTPAELGVAIDVEETGTTFEENALLKARAFHDASGIAAVADDSGLVVDALGGQPGVFSARYGGPGLDDQGRVDLLLRNLEGVPLAVRAARFVSAIALVADRGEWVFDGVVEGEIAMEPRGKNGFGYDPVFIYPPFGMTFGEAESSAKDRVSHRGRALRALADFLSKR